MDIITKAAEFIIKAETVDEAGLRLYSVISSLVDMNKQLITSLKESEDLLLTIQKELLNLYEQMKAEEAQGDK